MQRRLVWESLSIGDSLKKLLVISALLSGACATGESDPRHARLPHRSGIQFEIAGLGFDFGPHPPPVFASQQGAGGYALATRFSSRPVSQRRERARPGRRASCES